MDINPSRPDAQQTGERPLNLSDFAQRNQITEDRVWELIEEGELAARFVNDEILILREQETGDEPQIDLTATPEISVHEPSGILPTTPVDEPEVSPRPEVKADSIPHIDVRPQAATRKADTPEFSRVADIVRQMEGDDEQETRKDEETQVPTDDYRDLLVFAQDAMNRTMDLSRQLLATKDELIRMKEERIQQLQADQQRNEHEIRRLRKKVEDLETLCRLTPNP